MTTYPAPSADAAGYLRQIVSHAAHLLPIQGPIGVFIHHNTLHAFQHLPFEEAVIQAAELFGTQPYMREEQYREAFEQGRICLEDIDAVLNNEANYPVFSYLDRVLLRRTMLVPGVRSRHRATIHWELDEGKLLQGEEDSKLFSACLQRVDSAPVRKQARDRALRDILVEATGDDLDDIVHPFLIRVCSAYLDQGLAYWPMPEREIGFYAAIRSLWRHSGAILPPHLDHLPEAFERQYLAGMTAEEAVADCLTRLQVDRASWNRVITSELLALPGWAGLMRRLEEEPELAPHDRLPCSLMDFLAVRLTLTSVSASSIAGDPAILRQLQSNPPTDLASEADRYVRAAQIFEVLRLTRITAAALSRSDRGSFHTFAHEIEAFDDIERRRVWHLAYERRHERLILGPLGAHRQSTPVVTRSERPKAQVFFCLDEREESTRRHLEEVAPEIETFGAAGFYGIAVDYAGIDDAHGISLSPVVVKPQHAVREIPVNDHEHLHAKRKSLRAAWAYVARYVSVSSRTLVRGSLSTGLLGVFSLVPLIAHVLSPRQYSRLSRTLNGWILPEPRTEVTLMRTDQKGYEIADHLLLGFTAQEKIDRIASVLAPAGLYDRFAPIVVVLGHGSTSLNNPHESAHDCGACGGRRGGPNGRLFAAMANRPHVREGLRERGIHIPDDTWFVGGYHDTCNDDIEYFDLESMPATILGKLCGDPRSARSCSRLGCA